MLNLVRYGVPLALFLAGCAVSAGSGRLGLAAGAMFISAATAVLLLNVLYRIGVEGDKERDREEGVKLLSRAKQLTLVIRNPTDQPARGTASQLDDLRASALSHADPLGLMVDVELAEPSGDGSARLLVGLADDQWLYYVVLAVTLVMFALAWKSSAQRRSAAPTGTA